MIAKVTRGQEPSGAVRYLFGPGRYNEHEDPHVVAASASLRVEAGLRPTKAELEELAAAMDLPTVLFGTEVPAGACWHLSLSTKAGTDRELSDAEWAEVAQEAMSRLGFEASGHQAACRWVAVRHGRSSAGNDHVHVVVELVREDGKVARHGQRLPSAFPSLRRHGGPLRALGGRRPRPEGGHARAHPGRGGEGAPHRTGRSGAGRARPGGAGGGYRRRQRSRVRAVPPGRRAGGQAPLRPRRRASCGRLRGGRGALRRRGGGLLRWGEAGAGPLAPGPTGPLAPTARPRAGRPPPSGLVEPRRRACTRPLGPAGTSPTAGPRPQQRWGKSALRQEHRAPAQRSPARWREATEGLGEVVRELGAVPAEDVTTWRAVASDAAGVLAVLSGRLERIPGPLAHASGLLARSAQGPRQRPAKVRCVPRGTIKSVAALMAQADLDEDTPAAWRLLFAEMLRVVQAVHDAHLARSESEQAGRLADEARKALDNVRARLGSLEALRAELLAVVEAAQGEVGAGTGGGCEASAPTGGQRCAAARAVRRDDNGAGTAETVLGSGEVSVAEAVLGRTLCASRWRTWLAQPDNERRRRGFWPA